MLAGMVPTFELCMAASARDGTLSRMPFGRGLRGDPQDSDAGTCGNRGGYVYVLLFRVCPGFACAVSVHSPEPYVTKTPYAYNGRRHVRIILSFKKSDPFKSADLRGIGSIHSMPLEHKKCDVP